MLDKLNGTTDLSEYESLAGELTVVKQRIEDIKDEFTSGTTIH